MANDINLPNLVSHLQVNLADTSGIVAEATRQGSSVGAALGESMREQVARAVDEIPEVELDANSTDLDRDLDRVRRELRQLADTRIGVDISVEEALRRMEDLEPHLERLEHSHPSINVQAAVGGALADLEEIREAARHVDDTDVEIDVHVDTDRPTAGLSALRRAADSVGSALRGIGPALGNLAAISGIAGAAIPAVAGLVATLQQIAPAAAVGVSAVLAVASATAAVKIGTSGIGDALSAAFAPATGSGASAAASAASGIEAAQKQIGRAKEALLRTTEDAAERTAQADRRIADAERQLADTRTEAARNTRDALAGVVQAERQVADAQRTSLQVEQALGDARREAAEDLEDLASRVKKGKFAEREDTLALRTAEEALQKVRADPAATDAQRERAQLSYDEAAQALEDQKRENGRLAEQQKAASKAGVEGSKAVTDAKRRVTDATQQQTDAETDLQDARSQVAQTEISNQRAIREAAQGVGDAQREAAIAARDNARAISDAKDAILTAEEALTSAGAAGGGAAGGVDAFAEAMAKLSPSAQAFVREVVALKPALDSLKLDVQERLFAGLAEELDRTAHDLLPVLRESLDDSADSLNLMAKGAAAAARDIAKDGTLGRALDGANKGLANLVPIPGQIVTAIGQLGAAAAPAFDRLTKAAADSIRRMSDRLNKSFESGELEKGIDLAVGLLGQLLDVGGDVVQILTNIFAPAVSDGTNFIGVLGDITGALVDATAADGFQDAMSALFGVVAKIGQVGGPLLVKALEILEPVFVRLGPPAERLVDALGDALGPILDALAPLLLAAADAVGGLADASLPLIDVAGDLIAKLGPALQPILDDLADLFENDLGPAVLDVADALEIGLGPVLDALPDLIGPLADLVARNLVLALQALGDILVENGPSLAQLGLDLAQLFIAAGPLIDAFTKFSTLLLIKVAPAIIAGLEAATRFASYLVETFSRVVTNIVIPALHAITDLLHGRFGAAWDEVRAHAGDAILAILRLLTTLPGAAASALAPLAGKLGDRASEAGRFLLAPIREGIDRALRWIGDLPDMARDALGDLDTVLLDAGRSLLRGFLSGIKDVLPDLDDLLGSITSSLPIKKGPPERDATILRPAGRLVLTGFMDGIADQIPALTRQLAGITAGLGGWPSLAGAIPSGGALAATYAGSAAPAQGPTTINLYGTEATPEGVSSALSWRSKVGRR